MRYSLQILVIIIVVQVFTSCSSDTAPDCLKKAGKTIMYDVDVVPFAAIDVAEGIELVIKQGDELKISVETGENLKPDISIYVADNQLYLRNAAGCNWVRDYNSTTVYVTTPYLEKIYSSSQFAVKSEGVLNFPALLLQSGIFDETASGTFEISINSDFLTVEDNQSCYYKITGSVESLSVNFYAGDARFEGSSLIAQKVAVFHRSSNDIIVNPQQEIRGTLYGTGNLVLKNHPPVVEVERLYKGKLIFQ